MERWVASYLLLVYCKQEQHERCSQMTARQPAAIIDLSNEELSTTQVLLTTYRSAQSRWLSRGISGRHYSLDLLPSTHIRWNASCIDGSTLGFHLFMNAAHTICYTIGSVLINSRLLHNVREQNNNQCFNLYSKVKVMWSMCDLALSWDEGAKTV